MSVRDRFTSRRLAEFIYRWRKPLVALAFAGAILSLPRVNITKIDNDITAWFSRDDPVFKDYERFRAEFGGTRALIVALKADSRDRLFSRETLAFLDRVTADIERVDTVQRVDSLATATVLQGLPGAAGEDGGLDVRPLFERLDERDPADIARRALSDDLIRGDLVSEDATTTAIVVSFDEDRIDQVRAGVLQQIHNIIDPGLPAGVRSYYNGSIEISETYNRITLDNQLKFTPPIGLFTLVAIYFTFRSWRKTLLSVVAILVSICWTMGLYSLMGFTFNVLTSMLAPLVIVLAIADDVHIMQHWDEERRKGDDERAFKATVAHLAVPLLGASATTALGMLSLATSEVVAVRAFGIGSAVGIMVDFAISLVLVPTMLTWVRPELHEAPHEKYLIGPMQRIARFSTAHPVRVLVCSLLVGGVAALGMFRLRVDTNHINFFSRTHPLSQSAAVIDRELSGIYSFQIMLEGPADRLKTPDALQRMDRLEASLRAFPQVRKVTSVADYVKRINKELHDGRADASVVPGDPNTIAQELFVFALGGEGRHELERVVASDYSRAQISIKLQSMSSDLVLELVERADAEAKAVFAGSGITVLTTGSGRLFSTLDHYLVTSQLSSFGTAFLTVFAVIFVVFRSARFGFLTVVPNVLPVLAVLGVMGYLDISMNVATIMVASVALGVVDDDTIHFINRYRKEVAAGESTDSAIAIATAHEGRASLSTAIINSCGYGVLLLSEYKPTAWFGGLLALTMAVAFLAEVFILPAMIKLLPSIFGAEALRALRPRRASAACLLPFGIWLAWPATASAQAPARAPAGNVSVMGDYLPSSSGTTELRARAFLEEKTDVTSSLRLTASGFVESLAARRRDLTGTRGAVGDVVADLHDASLDFRASRFDLLAGYTRVVWGKLDEIQPSDVVNPLDVSKFFFDGRSEARLPVLLVRARAYVTPSLSIEGVIVPRFRRGRYDRLDEPTSPFNLQRDVDECVSAGTCVTIEPADERVDAQGGGRIAGTVGRLDWSASAYSGLEPFALYAAGRPSVGPRGTLITPLTASHPRFTMFASDFEATHGGWGVRGEAAVFTKDNFQSDTGAIATGSSVDAGFGVDRKAGDYRVSATVLVHAESIEAPVSVSGLGRTDVSIVGSLDRTFTRERYRLRAFGVVNPNEGSGFLRAIGIATLRDDLAIEGSFGWFLGDGRDIVGRFSDSDFVYARLKYYFRLR